MMNKSARKLRKKFGKYKRRTDHSGICITCGRSVRRGTTASYGRDNKQCLVCKVDGLFPKRPVPITSDMRRYWREYKQSRVRKGS